MFSRTRAGSEAEALTHKPGCGVNCFGIKRYSGQILEAPPPLLENVVCLSLTKLAANLRG